MLSEHDCAQVALVSNILSPLFLLNPKNAAFRPVLQGLAESDASALVADWPYGELDAARSSIALITRESQAVLKEPEGLIRAYRRLFVGPNHLIAPPWGSVYTDHDCVKFGESCLALREWMRTNGIASMGDGSEPDDFIGTMLAMLGWLAGNKPQLVEEFLREHLLTWSSHYLEKLEDAAQAEHGFYVAAAQLTRATLQGMQKSFDIVVDYPRYYC